MTDPSVELGLFIIYLTQYMSNRCLGTYNLCLQRYAWNVSVDNMNLKEDYCISHMFYTSVKKGLHKIPEYMSILLEIKYFLNIFDFGTLFCFINPWNLTIKDKILKQKTCRSISF